MIFWKSVQDAFARSGLDFLRDYACPTDAVGGGILADGLCHELAGETPCYIFIDDFHLLTDDRACAFMCTLANRLPENVHLIVASCDRFLPADEIVRLGSRVYQIGVEQLRLNHTELAVYAHRCGTELSDEQIESLLYSSEGWFSAVYLNLRTLSERGSLPDRDSDIYAMFIAAMIDPLTKKQRELLAVMGLADEFTAEMARFVTGDSDAQELLDLLMAQNAFVLCGVAFNFSLPLIRWQSAVWAKRAQKNRRIFKKISAAHAAAIFGFHSHSGRGSDSILGCCSPLITRIAGGGRTCHTAGGSPFILPLTRVSSSACVHTKATIDFAEKRLRLCCCYGKIDLRMV